MDGAASNTVPFTQSAATHLPIGGGVATGDTGAPGGPGTHTGTVGTVNGGTALAAEDDQP
jgi:hypothetical protein